MPEFTIMLRGQHDTADDDEIKTHHTRLVETARTVAKAVERHKGVTGVVVSVSAGIGTWTRDAEGEESYELPISLIAATEDADVTAARQSSAQLAGPTVIDVAAGTATVPATNVPPLVTTAATGAEATVETTVTNGETRTANVAGTDADERASTADAEATDSTVKRRTGRK